MRISLITLSAVAMLAVASIAPAQVITQFTFETNTPPDSTGATAGPFNSDSGILTAVLNAQHAAATTAYTTPAGNGSANSFSSSAWAVGDFYQVTLPNTTGYSGLSLSFAATSSSTGPANFSLQYSTNGTTYTTFANYVVPVVTFSMTTPNATAIKTFDLSGVTALNNSATAISFRLTDASTLTATGGTVGATGTSRIDDFTVSVPEPSTYALMAGAFGLLLVGQRIRRTARA